MRASLGLLLSATLVLGCGHKRPALRSTATAPLLDTKEVDLDATLNTMERQHKADQYLEEKLEDIDHDLKTRPDLAELYLLPAKKEIKTLKTMSVDDAGYAELFSQLHSDMAHIDDLEEMDTAE